MFIDFVANIDIILVIHLSLGPLYISWLDETSRPVDEIPPPFFVNVLLLTS